MYLGQQTGIQGTEETVRVSFHAHTSVCKRSPWSLRRKAEEQVEDVGNACASRFFELGRADPNLYPFMSWLTLIGGISGALTWKHCSRSCRVLTCIEPR